MSYARRIAMAGAVVVGCALGLPAQDVPSEPKDGAPTKTAPSKGSRKSARSRGQDTAPAQPTYQTGNKAADLSASAENSSQDSRQSSKAAADSELTSPRRESVETDEPTIQF